VRTLSRLSRGPFRVGGSAEWVSWTRNIVGTPRASSTQRRRWPRNLRLFSFFLCFLWFRRYQIGEEAEAGGEQTSCRIEGHGWAARPPRGSTVSLEEGEEGRSLRVRSYQR